MTKALGEEGERLAASLLRSRGFEVREIGGNFPTIDLEVRGSVDFRVSVKTSASKRHVRLGSPKSVSRLLDNDFVFAFMPKSGSEHIDLVGKAYDLWIIPGAMARDGALWVHNTYLEGKTRAGGELSGSAGILVKSYSRRPPQRQTWGEWEGCLDRWDFLPSP